MGTVTVGLVRIRQNRTPSLEQLRPIDFFALFSEGTKTIAGIVKRLMVALNVLACNIHKE